MKVMVEWKDDKEQDHVHIFNSWTEYQDFQISQTGAMEIMHGVHDLKETEVK